MMNLLTFLAMWFFVSIPSAFFVGAIFGLAKKSSDNEVTPAPQTQHNFSEKAQKSV